MRQPNPLRHPSLSDRMAQPPRSMSWRIGGLTLGVFMGLGIVLGGGLWFKYGTIQGVPTAIVFKFLADEQSRAAYFSGQPSLLHDRLRNMGIEEEIKAFYRDQYPDEVELDLFIHQLLYDRTGYVGKNYRIGFKETLILKSPQDRAFPRWLVLARRANVVIDSREDNGVQMVTLPDGTYATYEAVSEIYTIPLLRQLIREQNQRKKRSRK